MKVQLLSDRLILRPINEMDIHHLYALLSEEFVAKYSPLGIPENEEVVRSMIDDVIDNADTYFIFDFWWAITCRESHIFLGEIGMNLSPTNPRNAEIHYALFPDFWQRGISLEAIETVINFGFVDKNLHRIVANVATGNIASIKLLERVGMTRRGKLRRLMPLRGEWWDSYEYMIQEEVYFGDNKI